MTATVAVGQLAAVEPKAVAPSRKRWLVDIVCISGYLLAAFGVLCQQWFDLDRGYLAFSGEDQNQWEWFFAVTAHSLANLDDLLFSTLQNHPTGVNLMANTVMLGLGVPLAPVTLVFGPTVTWALVLTGGLAGTATAWYWVLSRHVVRSRLAAAVGAGFCGFAPPIVSHANAHPNFVVLFVIPLIVLRLIRIHKGQRPVRDGVLLGLLIAYQILLGEEVLLFAATGLVVYALAYAAMRPAQARAAARPLATGLLVAAGVSLVLVAYPLWWQFFGTQSYHSVLHGPVGNDVTALTAFASESLAGDPAIARPLSLNAAEENAFFGWPLLVLVAILTVWLWRIVAARALAIVVVSMAALSLGVEIVVDGVHTGIPGPWLLLSWLPLYDSVIESRFTFACIPAIGILLALGIQRVITVDPVASVSRVLTRALWFVAFGAALVPIVPTPLHAIQRSETPQFFATGSWRQYVTPGRSVVTVPLPSPGDVRSLKWQTDAGFGFALPEGYFMGPDGPDRNGMYGAVVRPTSALLAAVAVSGEVPAIDGSAIQAAHSDLRFWRAAVVVLPRHARQDALRTTVEKLLGPGQYVDDVWIWDVRSLAR